ncbi:MAG: hypothetical protein IPN42_17410 [Methylococcaceae bacterium]|nr:hypothetical protein [Methylococcaceae bacterium]
MKYLVTKNRAPYRLGAKFLIYGVLLSAGTAIAGTVSQKPLFLTTNESPNVLINLSVEGPMGGAAYADQPGNPDGCTGRKNDVGGFSNADNIGACYFKATEYLGYFDPNKCYTYNFTNSRFEPGKPVINSNHECTTRTAADGRWSGNFLNWATMTSIDEFIWTMTGGNRISDTTSLTVIRRALSHSGWFPVKVITSSLNVAPNTVTPFTSSTIFLDSAPPTTAGGGRNGSFKLNIGSTYDKATNKSAVLANATSTAVDRAYNVDVKVCGTASNKELNCKVYYTTATPPVPYYKPEGLIQQDSLSKRFALTSYTLDNTSNRQGGVLRSKMKYVGPLAPDLTGTLSNNPIKEFGVDGIIINNPESATGSLNSGIINYINKFSSLGYKSFDPVSELYYEAIRYYKNLGPTPENYSGIARSSTDTKAGGFWFYQAGEWDNPIQFSCQKNFIIAINDGFPWFDKRLPGTAFATQTINTTTVGTTYDLNNPWAFGGQGYSPTADYGQPSNPDTAINVKSFTDSVGTMENGRLYTSAEGSYTFNLSQFRVGGGDGTHGVNQATCSKKNILAKGLGSVLATCPGTSLDTDHASRDNTYYVAGLAWYANTNDIRPDFPDKQSVTSFMIDTQEFSSAPNVGPNNMLWLAGKYGGFIDLNNDKNPNNTNPTEPANSEWDADNDGEPDNYVLASKPAKLVDSLSSAFRTIDKVSASASAAAANTTRFQTNSLLFRGIFTSGKWIGDLLAFNLTSEDANNNGTLDTGEDTNGNNVLEEGIISVLPFWKASDGVPLESNRKIFTYDPQLSTPLKGVEFKWPSLNETQKSVLDNANSAAASSPLLNYLRGDQTNENPLVAGRYRPRDTLLGDIIDSDPLFIGGEDLGYALLPSPEGTSYGSYMVSKQAENDMLYIGSNDGMLHAIIAEPNLANGGKEEFAYVPNAVISQDLAGLANVNYSHQYFVDGSPQGGDVYFGGAWHTVVIGTMGAGSTTEVINPDKNGDGILTDPDLPSGTGGKGIFALDVSNPDGFNQNNVLWEFSSRNDPDLGYTMPQPSVVRMANGQWAAIVANGYNSTLGKSALFIINVSTGAIIKKIVAENSGGNGLSSPLTVDVNDDKVIDFIYAGDLKGNLWKFDVSSSNPSTWDVAFSTASCGTASPSNCVPLFVACATNSAPCSPADRQPITSKPSTRKPHASGQEAGGVMLFFGTGKYFEVGDQLVGVNPQIQSFFTDFGIDAALYRQQFAAFQQ